VTENQASPPPYAARDGSGNSPESVAFTFDPMEVLQIPFAPTVNGVAFTQRSSVGCAKEILIQSKSEIIVNEVNMLSMLKMFSELWELQSY